MNNTKLMISLILITALLTACSGDISKSEANEASDTASKASASTNVQQSIPSKAETKSIVNTADIVQKTKDYILNGQGDKPEAEKLKWSETFLNNINIDELYQKYLSSGGKAEDIKSFAMYLTPNAPIADNWQQLAAADLLKTYGEKISRLELLQDNLYQAYVIIEGKEVPFVVFNARTGYFHG